MHVADLVSDYLAKGVAHIWIVDPRTRSGWDCRQSSWVRTDEFEISGLPLTVKLTDLGEEAASFEASLQPNPKSGVPSAVQED